MQRLTIRAKTPAAPSEGAIDVFVWHQTPNGDIHPTEITVDTNSTATVQSCATLSEAEARQLMDDLWLAGVRPSIVPDIPGVIIAKNAHIAFAEKTATSLIECLGARSHQST